MASTYVTELKGASEALAEQGYPVTAGICSRAADRMERMEDLIMSLQDQVEAIDDTRQTSQQKSEDGLSTKHRPPITGE